VRAKDCRSLATETVRTELELYAEELEALWVEGQNDAPDGDDLGPDRTER
jgi:hypothetical protein